MASPAGPGWDLIPFRTESRPGTRTRRLTLYICAWAAWLGLATPAASQDVREPLPARVIGTGGGDFVVFDREQSDARARELKQWMADFEKWKRWNEQYRNTREQGWLKTKSRRERPDPPAWLAEECRGVSEDDQGTLPDACRLLAEWRDDDTTAQLRAQMSAARTQ